MCIGSKREEAYGSNAGFLSSTFMTYLDPLLKLGARKVLNENDIGPPQNQYRAHPVYDRLKTCWTEECERCETKNQLILKRTAQNTVPSPKLKTPSMWRALILAVGPMKVVFALLLYLVSMLIQFVPVLLLEDLIRYFETLGSSTPHECFMHPWWEVILLGISPLVVSLLQNKHFMILLEVSIFFRTGISTLLYEKSLQISPAGRMQTSTGEVVNMMSNDTNQIQRFLQLLGLTSMSPVTVVIALYMIYLQVGVAMWVGVGVLLLTGPINAYFFKLIGQMRRKVLKYSDSRVKLINEVLAGIRIIKYYAWEKPFGVKISELREQEMKFLTYLAYVTAVGFSFLLMAIPIIQPILVFLAYTKIEGVPMSAATAFTTVVLFQIMRFPFALLPLGLIQYIQTQIAIKRLESYMLLPNLEKYVENGVPPNTSDSSKKVGSVTMTNCSFSWGDSSKASEKEAQKDARKKKGRKTKTPPIVATTETTSDESEPKALRMTLHDISFAIEAGSLTAVLGTVGSGKSSLLAAIMGEMQPMNESKVYVPRGDKNQDFFLSYCAQTPWIVNDTLRGNILFGRKFDEKRYQAVTDACALSDDLKILPAGDMTEIGERGINLSGGQKARVSLARAIYSARSQILLLDDPLSAVDAHVAEHIFSNAVTGPVSHGMTRVLVTHNVRVLPHCDKVIVLNEGTIEHIGTYNELVTKGVDFKDAADCENSTKDDDKESEEQETETTLVKKRAASVDDVPENVGAEKKLKEEGEKLITDEDKEEGSVSTAAYFHYGRAGGMNKVVLLFVVQTFGRVCEVLATFWLAYWSEKSVEGLLSGNNLTVGEVNYYLSYYAIFALLGVFALGIRATLIAVHRLYASRMLHGDLTESILRAPVSFFDVTPTGRILNRFAADMDKIDLELTNNLSQGINCFFTIVGALGAMIIATKGAFVLPMIPLFYIYYIAQKWFRKTSTELQRITNVATSPIFSDFSQILSGTSTVRAYGQQNRFFEKSKSGLDKMNAAYSLVQLTNYWLGIRLDFVGAVMSSFIAAFAVGTSSFLPAGWIGLALSYSIEITGFLKYGVRSIATVEADMSSVERVLYYTQNVTPEAPAIIPEKEKNLEAWPARGNIKITNASMRYREGPLVLKNITLEARGGEKIGVVGRTGSGKSSLMNLLFRIVEIENDGGTVTIDDVDTAQIGTEILRRRISIIPQDPVLFSSTIKYNLDPFDDAKEEELWAVLAKVQLKTFVDGLPQKLEEPVSEGGENLSQGQRQLICIARSLLRKPKILVMDEATASIDNTTDELVQKMIRENFCNSTVLTIAHRLNTIMDSNRILVLDDGNIAQFDTPKNLLAVDGIFKSMVEKSRRGHPSNASMGSLE